MPLTVKDGNGNLQTVETLNDLATAGLPVNIADGAPYADATGATALSPTTGFAVVLKGLFVALKNMVLAAGENHIGGVGGSTAVATATLTRTTSTTAYASGQLIGNAAADGASAPIAVPVARKNGGTGSIRRARVSTTRTNGTGTDVIRVHLYKGSAAGVGPTTSAADGGTFAGSTNIVGAVYLGYFDVTLTTLGTDGAKGNAVPAVGGEINFDTYAGQNTIYAFIEARSAITPISGETITVALEVLQD